MLLLAAVTLVWLVAQGASAVRETDRLYPVTAYAMFSQPTDGTSVDVELRATTLDGDAFALDPHDFGLTYLQYRDNLRRHVGLLPGRLSPDADENLERIASIWESRHGAVLDSLEYWRIEHSFDESEPRNQELIRWLR